MVVIVNITGENNGQNSDQNFNLIATINWAAPIYENNIRHTSVKNWGEKSGKNYDLYSVMARVLLGVILARIQAWILIA